jgi:hypothetical protein
MGKTVSQEIGPNGDWKPRWRHFKYFLGIALAGFQETNFWGKFVDNQVLHLKKFTKDYEVRQNGRKI